MTDSTKGKSSSTRLAVRRQSKLSFKNKKPRSVGVKSELRRAVVDPSKLMYRSNMAGVIKTVSEVMLSEAHIIHLQKTPFWLMIDAIRTNNLTEKTFKKCDETVCRIIQTYNPADEKFYIGGKGIPLRNSDVRLIFGIQCGRDKLDLTYRTKPPSDFIQRRCSNIGRISCKAIKELMVEALQGTTPRDEEDVAKLLCLYICAKLFFATTGETIGWAYVRAIDKLETLRLYDWTTAIRNMLMGSLNDFCNKPAKVTGCVVALLFLVCEHTNLIEPERPKLFPRFCNWNLGNLIRRIKLMDLTSESIFEVNCEKLSGPILERYQLNANVSDMEGQRSGDLNIGVNQVMKVAPESVWDGNVEGSTKLAAASASLEGWKSCSPTDGHIEIESKLKDTSTNTESARQSEKTLGDILATGEKGPDLFPNLLELSSTPVVKTNREKTKNVEQALIKALVKIKELENESVKKAERVKELEGRVSTMERMIGEQCTNMFMGFDGVVRAKDIEIERLTGLVTDLQARIVRLEDQIDDHEAHIVSQSVMNDNASCQTFGDRYIGNNCVSNLEAYDGSQLHSPSTNIELRQSKIVIADCASREDRSNIGLLRPSLGYSLSAVSGNDTPMPDKPIMADYTGSVVGVDASCTEFGFVTIGSPKINSLVRHVKEKSRREWKLADYEYPRVVVRTKQQKYVGPGVVVVSGDVVNVDDGGEVEKTWAGFRMNHKLPVWKMLSAEEQKRLEDVYRVKGDGAVIWGGVGSDVQVCFADVQALVQQLGIKGNVIDVYADILTDLQTRAAATSEYVDRSYFYSSICADMMRNPSAESRDRYLKVQFNAAKGCRYIHFPIYYSNHWTIMVHDSECGMWRHYNSMHQRKGSRDHHFTEALKMKEWVTDYTKRLLKEGPLAEEVATGTMDGELESVIKCPQQEPDSADCGIMICFIMRQYVHKVEIDGSMDGLNPNTFRGALVKTFMNDPRRGLRTQAV